MFDWLRKRLGYHVYEEFTQWQVHSADFSRPPSPVEDAHCFIHGERVEYTKYWQERRCTVCGAVEQRVLEYPARSKPLSRKGDGGAREDRLP